MTYDLNGDHDEHPGWAVRYAIVSPGEDLPCPKAHILQVAPATDRHRPDQLRVWWWGYEKPAEETVEVG